MIYLIIPVHNRRETTRKCLMSLSRQENPDFQVVVIDDGSTDGTHEMIQNDFPEVIVLPGDGNLWWTGATNRGIAYAMEHGTEADYVMLLNDDLEVDEQFIAVAYQAIHQHPDTLIQAVESTNQRRGMIVNGGWTINWLTAKFRQLNQNRFLSEFPGDHVEPVSTQTGRGTLIPIKVFYEIGLYNDQHYPQCGDFEFPVRASRAGYRLIMYYGMPVYSFTDDTDRVNVSETFSLRDIKSYYWGFRSYANLKNRFHFAYDTASNWLQGTVFLFFDTVRITYNFVSKLSLNK